MKRFLIAISLFLGTTMALMAQEDCRELIYLENGSIIKGRILSFEPKGEIRIQTSDGSLFVYEASKVLKIESPQLSSSSQSSSMSAQLAPAKSSRELCYQGSASIFLGFDATSDEESSISIETSHGILLKNRFYFGAGVAMMNIGYDEFVCPLFLHSKINFRKSRFTPFVEGKMGYSLDDVGGVYLSPSIGYQFGWGRKGGANIALTYNFYQIRESEGYNYDGYYYDYGQSYSANSFGIKLSIQW